MFRYVLIEDVESLEGYGPGGFFPISLGDTMKQGRFSIVHKLGYGGYSTVWLALDLTTKEYVALKEVQLLQQLSSSPSQETRHPGQVMIGRIIDAFTTDSVNGTHKCFVTTPAMMSLEDAKESSDWKLFQPRVARAIAAQLVLAIDYIHRRGIVHADLHLGNILLRLPQAINDLTPEQLYRRYGEPEAELIQRVDQGPLDIGVPESVIFPAWLGKKSEDVTLAEASILLSDFGESFRPALTRRTYSRTLQSVAPPEARFQDAGADALSFPADIWSLACVIWEVLGQRPLFDSWFATEDGIIAAQVEFLGKPPNRWWNDWKARPKYFVEGEGETLTRAPPRDRHAVWWGWDERFELCIQKARREINMEQVSEDERAVLFSMLASMLAWGPERRAKASEVVQSEWMRKWALPDLKS